MTIQKQQNDEQLSALIDAEQLETETSQIVTHLLNDSEYKERYIRLQYAQNALSNKPLIDVRSKVSLALDTLPTHFVDEAVSLQAVSTKDITHTSWFQREGGALNGQKMITGMSIAVSVMFATFFSLQLINSPYDSSSHDMYSNSNIKQVKPYSATKQNELFFDPSIISPFAELPALLVSYPATSILQWQEDDLEISQQVNEQKPKIQNMIYKQSVTK